MFTELAGLAKASPIALLISEEGDELRVNVTQKSGKKGAPLNLSIVAPPADLDAELVNAIVQASGTLRTVKPIAEQVQEQVDSAASGSSQKRSNARRAATKQAKPKAATAPKKTPTKAKPGRTVPPPKAAAKKKPASRAEHTRVECVDDLVTLIADHGAEKVNREFFIKKGTTARSFERHFGGWHKFKAAGEKAAAKPAGAADDTLPLPLETNPPAGETKPATSETPAADSDTTTAAAEITYETPGAAQVLSTGPDDESIITTATGETERAGGGEPQPPATAAGEPTAPEATPKPDGWPFPNDHTKPKTRDVLLRSGKLVMIESREVQVGEELTYGGKGTFRVLECDSEDMIIVEPVTAEQPAAAPLKIRKVIDDEGTRIGDYTNDILTEGEIIKVAERDWTVMGFNEKAVFVEPAPADDAVEA